MNRRLAAALAAGFAVRAGYVALQPRFDPTFARPILDGGVYVASAREWIAGGAPVGVFYMPPLYPFALSLFFRLFGEAWSALFLLQHLAVIGAAALAGVVTRRFAGEAAGLATAVLVLLYHPALFFASRPLGEALALLLIAAGLALAPRDDEGSGLAAGFLAGLASLARPNFLPVAPAWAAGDVLRRRGVRAALLIAGVAVAVLPAAWHNYVASGRLVPVSANGGVVFWLGNAPGAVGVYTPVNGLTGSLATQQDEAIAEARARSGRPLDAVESDGFWWRQGLAARAADVSGSLLLLARRALLTVDNAEHGLDYAPALDANPLRFAAPLPFALLLGLAVFGVSTRGFGATGGAALWSALAVAAAAPIVFYVSSRHRLPVAFLLTVPAGAGVAALRSTRKLGPFVAGAAAVALSFSVPSSALMRAERASALTVVADVQHKAGEMEAAAATARLATELDPANAVAWFNRGVIEAAAGDRDAAERDYRAALAADPGQPDAAANLGALLVITGRAGEGIPVLERALAAWPRHAVGWTNLVVAYAASGDPDRAREAARRASEAGVTLDPELIETLEGEKTP